MGHYQRGARRSLGVVALPPRRRCAWFLIGAWVAYHAAAHRASNGVDERMSGTGSLRTNASAAPAGLDHGGRVGDRVEDATRPNGLALPAIASGRQQIVAPGEDRPVGAGTISLNPRVHYRYR